ncbi:MAG: VWA domain-containing protein [Spirochaetia bacterium]|nr:VWA domain-containing protein [Spirochaetia bacterium]
MEFDQFLFKKAIRLLDVVRGRKSVDSALSNRQATLKSSQSRLTILARAITGRPVEIVTAETGGGISGNIIYLPPQFSLFVDQTSNQQFFIWRLCLLCTAESMRHETSDITGIIRAMLGQFPMLAHYTDHLIASGLQAGSIESILGFYVHAMPQSKLSATDSKERHSEQQIQTELEGKTRENIRSHEVDKKAIEDYTLNHSFEKVETIEEFQGNWRDMDGSDDLSDHEEALNEMDLRDTIRSDTPVHSVLKTEFFADSGAAESRDYDSVGHFVTYPEWDFKKRIYRKDFCRLYLQSETISESDYADRTLHDHHKTMGRLRSRMNRVNNDLQTVRLQSSGEDPDIERLVDNFGEVRAGKTPDERVYLSKRKRSFELTISVLMDLSLSTDSFTGGRRILDVEKQAVTLFAQMLEETSANFSIGAFYSHTRNQCQFISVKEFNEPWSHAKNRIGGLSSRGYTRIGPAIRHATQLVERQATRRKWILLISDGKPNDYDRYEGRHGIEDVKKSIQEARVAGVRSYALAVEADAKNYLPAMFGKGFYRILPRPEILPEALSEFYVQLKQSG